MKKIEVKMICKVCEREVIVKPSRSKYFKTCSKNCFARYMKGHKPFNYKGGKLIHRGYVYILKKDHPNSDRDGYVLEHRLVMEKNIGRYLTEVEVVHHINENRSDNRIKNLELLKNQSEHIKKHCKKGTQGFHKNFL